MGRLLRTGGTVLGTVLALVCAAVPTRAQTTELYQEACDAGDGLACNVFGLMYETGSDVTQDFERAASLYERACDLGAFIGCANLGLMLETGTGVARDINRARLLHALACQGGESLGCERLEGLTNANASVSPDAFRRGRVRHAATGEPLAETLITVGENAVSALSDSQGFFMLPPLPSGRHPLRADRVGYEVTEGEIQVPGEAELLVLLTPGEVEDPNAPGRIEGRVSADQGDALRNVEITVVGQPAARALTNGQGRFVLSGVEPGSLEVQLALLGYTQRTVVLVVHPGRTTEVTAALSTDVIELAPIQVVVRSGYLERNGFYSRERSVRGRFFDRADIEEIDPGEFSDLLRRVPGLSVRYRPLGGAVAQSRRSMAWGLNSAPGQGVFIDQGPGRLSAAAGSACLLTVYVDGVPTFDSDLDWISTSWLEGVEVYTSGINTPMMFTVGGATCGAVAVWTRR